MVQANAGHLWHIRNGLLEKQKSEHQKAILEVPTQIFGIWRNNMKRGKSDYLSEYITFILWKLCINPKKRGSSKVGMLFFPKT